MLSDRIRRPAASKKAAGPFWRLYYRERADPEAALADFLLGLLDRGYACAVYRDGSGRRMKARTAVKRLATLRPEDFDGPLSA